MKIIVDVMGGDAGVAAAVEGAVMAVREFNIEALLVGKSEEIDSVLASRGFERKGLEILHAGEVITMEDDPSGVIRSKKDASMVVALQALGRGDGDALVSAGNTGALLIGATLFVKRIHGIRRAALAPLMPTETGKVLLIDSGANVECTPDYLLHFALMGSAYAECVMKKSKPRVALLNNGTEDKKGPPLQVETNKLLRAEHEAGRINFIGNLEARDVFTGSADVLVCDGFTGNIFLKTAEGIGLMFAGFLKRMFLSSLLTKLGALLLSGGIKELKQIMDYKETGGAPILGIAKPVIKAHGSSDPRAFRGAIKQAIIFTQSGAIEKLQLQMNAAAASGQRNDE